MRRFVFSWILILLVGIVRKTEVVTFLSPERGFTVKLQMIKTLRYCIHMRYVFVWIQSNAERRKLIEKLITNAKKKSKEIC